ncbi:MAG TPA: rhodanese-like domain-containing protein [Thermoanaerobaculia bacterium]|nr:rhodanese-like domain-containing protein [Thermoanaerobaculia bacterium]
MKNPRTIKRHRGAAAIAAISSLLLLGGWAMTRSKAPAPPAVSPPPAAAEEHSHAGESSVPRLRPADIASWVASGAVTVIDVRDIDSYLAGHIAGSLHIPLSRLAGELPYLQRGRPYIAYCT